MTKLIRIFTGKNECNAAEQKAAKPEDNTRPEITFAESHIFDWNVMSLLLYDDDWRIVHLISFDHRNAIRL